MPDGFLYIHALAGVLQLGGSSDADTEITPPRKHQGRIVSIAIIASALITGLLVVGETNKYPRTDDAEVFANFIGIAPQVEGPITQLAVRTTSLSSRETCSFRLIRGRINMPWKRRSQISTRLKDRSAINAEPLLRK